MTKIKNVKCRDGKIVSFKFTKLQEAIKKAFRATQTNGDEETLNDLSLNVASDVTRQLNHFGIIADIEVIQDIVEKTLMQKSYHKVAKEYILYREKRSIARGLLKDCPSLVKNQCVIKRDGRTQVLSYDKIVGRVCNQSCDLTIDINKVVGQTIAGLSENIHTSDLDNYLAEVTSSLVVEHPDYAILAGRFKASGLHKETRGFARATDRLYSLRLLREDYYEKTQKHMAEIESMICYERDYAFDYFAIMTFCRAYLLRENDKILERPQDLWMRVALTVACDDGKFNFQRVKDTYDLMSQGYYTHATPTLFNSGLKHQQLSSCFLLAIESDSIKGIFNTLKDCAVISKTAGGIGVHAHNIRSSNTLIKTTNGRSNGIIPFIKIYNETARAVDQGGGKRKGSFAIYLEPWHADIEQFLELRKNTGAEEFRARDLFYALWIPDLFMKRVFNNENWSLMSEDECPGLSDVYGDEFEALYTKYEREGKVKRTLPASDLMTKIVNIQIETGMPYMLYKDAVNKKSNQKNIGVIKSSNLCAEIVEYSDSQETAVCNLASISLPAFLTANAANRKEGSNIEHCIDLDKLIEVTETIVRNLDNVIDVNFYPTKKAYKSNKRHRPIGIGVQGLADLYFKLGIAFDSKEAKKLNRMLFEWIYYAAVFASSDLAKEKGTYKTFKGSPMSQGKLQFDLWGLDYINHYPYYQHWIIAKDNVRDYGMRHSLLTTCMPTASTSILFGNIETMQPQTSNLYKRQTLSGEFILINRYLVKDLEKLGLWTNELRDQIIINSGSIQKIAGIPQYLKDIYRTVWEMSMRTIIDMAADRGPFIDQSQSMNLWLKGATPGKVRAMHKYAWEKGLKTGMYYLRTQAAADAFKVTVSPEGIKKQQVEICENCTA